ncbi:MAG: hypothetical protein LBU64_10690 [Planctomycetota bacterium]|jgi:hypothetical protein|nr:hypothetical protein [Planctomycetota bacterium]
MFNRRQRDPLRGRLLFAALLFLSAAPPGAADIAFDKALNLGRSGGRRGSVDCVVVDFADQTGDASEPRLGGGTAGLGRYLRNRVARTYRENDIRVLGLGDTLAVLEKLGFAPEDVEDDGAVRRLLSETGAEALIYGIISSTRDPAVLQLETIARRLVDGESLIESILIDLVMDRNLEFAKASNLPPLSDNRPNTVLSGHPLIDVLTPYGLEVLGAGGPKPLRVKNDRLYIAGDPGESYRIRLRNNSRWPVAVSLFVDMVPAAGGAGDDPAELAAIAEKIVVDADSEVVLDRRPDGGEEFRFSEVTDSDSQTREYWQDAGVITASFYPAAEKATADVWDVDDSDSWSLKEFPASGGKSLSSRAAGRSGRSGTISHFPSPSAILSLHYDVSRNVNNYRALGK